MRTLEITPQIGCKNRCSYCPIDKLVRTYKDKKKVMTFSDFIHLLGNVPKDVRIDFSGFSEVFLNKSGALMIAYAKKMGYDVAIYTTLVGFTEDDAKLLSDMFFGDIFLHQHDGKNFNQEYFDSQMALMKKYVKGNYRTSKLEKQWQWSRAGNVWDTEKADGKFTCGLCGDDYNHNVLLPNGDVYLCCQDWSLKHKIGNLYDTHYDDLDRESIKGLASCDKSEIICRNCEHFVKEL